LNLDDKNKKN